MRKTLIDSLSEIANNQEYCISDKCFSALDSICNVKCSEKDLIYLLNSEKDDQKALFEMANIKKKLYFNNKLLVRGVVEISNICENDCKYCAMSKRNTQLKRYFISYESIIKVIQFGIENNIRTFHISSGENRVYSDEVIAGLIDYIKSKNCNVILVLGNKEIGSLHKFTKADAYISKFETSNPWLYYEYNNKNNNLDERIFFIQQLKKMRFKVGTGNIVGLPFQNDRSLVRDLYLLKELSTDFASTSSFIPNEYSALGKFGSGDVSKTLNFIAIMRLFLKENVIIPTNSSVGTDHRLTALDAGANLISVNLTPDTYLNNYIIYDESKRKKANFNEIDRLKEKYEIVYSINNLMGVK